MYLLFGKRTKIIKTLQLFFKSIDTFCDQRNETLNLFIINHYLNISVFSLFGQF